MVSTLSYWQKNAPAIDLSTQLIPSVDVAILGGGIIGASLCYMFARDGFSVALLERNTLAYGASGRNGGFVVAGPAESYPDAMVHLGVDTARSLLQLTHENQHLLRQIIDEERIDCQYQESGTIKMAVTPSQAEKVREEVSVLQREGLNVCLLERKELQQLIKTPLAEDILLGSFSPQQGKVHSALLVQGLVHAASRYRAHAYHASVQKIVTQQNSINVFTPQGTIQAKVVISAVNAWTSILFPMLENVIIPIREQMLAFKPIEPMFLPTMTTDIVENEYWQQRPDGTILLGGCGAADEGAQNNTWSMETTAIVQNALEGILPRLFPHLPLLQPMHRWAGLLDYTTDSCPIIDQLPNQPNVYVVAGFSGHGMPFGLRLGQLLVETVRSGVLSSKLKPYRLTRSTLKTWDSFLKTRRI